MPNSSNNLKYYYIENSYIAIPKEYLEQKDKNFSTFADVKNKLKTNLKYNEWKNNNILTKDIKNTGSLVALWSGVMDKTAGYDLIPRTIEYSAGLMKLWYDVVNEPPWVKEVEVIDVNNTINDIDKIYWAEWVEEKDKDGKRIRKLYP
ncbi:MAG: hypothetical protein HY934_05690, partial [Candidatus Firestonebacteria bacterium]|nr:hypothetical protein [Candidatus Firestonebacteria bacterium]